MEILPTYLSSSSSYLLFLHCFHTSFSSLTSCLPCETDCSLPTHTLYTGAIIAHIHVFRRGTCSQFSQAFGQVKLFSIQWHMFSWKSLDLTLSQYPHSCFWNPFFLICSPVDWQASWESSDKSYGISSAHLVKDYALHQQWLGGHSSSLYIVFAQKTASSLSFWNIISIFRINTSIVLSFPQNKQTIDFLNYRRKIK